MAGDDEPDLPGFAQLDALVDPVRAMFGHRTEGDMGRMVDSTRCVLPLAQDLALADRWAALEAVAAVVGPNRLRRAGETDAAYLARVEAESRLTHEGRWLAADARAADRAEAQMDAQYL